MFEQAVLHGSHSECAVVMVLNQIHLLPHFDVVLFIDNGVVATQGTFAEVSQSDQYQAWVSRITPNSEPGSEAGDADITEGGEDEFNANEVVGAHTAQCDDPPRARHSIPVIPSPVGADGTEKGPTSPLSDRPTSKGIESADSPTGETEHVRLLIDEKQMTGRVSSAVISKYIKQMGRWSFYGSGIIIFVSYAIGGAGADILLGVWAQESEKQASGELSQSEDAQFASVYVSSTIL